jgi:zinc transport system substrate-binding protein
MKKIPLSRSHRAQLGSLVLLAALAIGCGPAPPVPRPTATPTVVATLYPLAWLTRQLVEPSVEVVQLTPAGAEPHDFELAADQVAALLAADQVVYLAGFQAAVDRVVAQRAGLSFDVLATPGLALRGLAATPGHDHGAVAGAVDPHIWLDPQRLALVARALAAQLAAPSGRLAALEERLAALDAELAAGTASCRRREVLTPHLAFGYFCERYRLEPLSLAGFDPEGEPRPRDLEALIARGRRLGITTVFAESARPMPVVSTVARGLGAQVLSLHPIETLAPAEEAAGADYLSLMRRNLVALQRGLECPPPSS